MPGAQLGGVATPLSYPQILPQAMTVFQWLLRMWWEWELQEHVQHNPSVSVVTIYLVLLLGSPATKWGEQGTLYHINDVKGSHD